jgi:hypothetical protein
MGRSTCTDQRSYYKYVLTACSDFLKERLFGLSNPQGNHGESIKEAHFHLDNVPTVGEVLLAQHSLLTVTALLYEVPL